jgi:hypothetical protein
VATYSRQTGVGPRLGEIFEANAQTRNDAPRVTSRIQRDPNQGHLGKGSVSVGEVENVMLPFQREQIPVLLRATTISPKL